MDACTSTINDVNDFYSNRPCRIRPLVFIISLTSSIAYADVVCTSNNDYGCICFVIRPYLDFIHMILERKCEWCVNSGKLSELAVIFARHVESMMFENRDRSKGFVSRW